MKDEEIDLLVRDFCTAQEDHRIAPSASGPKRHGYIGPTTNGPKYSGPSGRKLWAKGPKDRGFCNSGSFGTLPFACDKGDAIQFRPGSRGAKTTGSSDSVFGNAKMRVEDIQ